MADTKTEDLDPATTLDGTEVVHVVQGGNSRQMNTGATGGGNAGLGGILQLKSEKGAANGYASLNSSGKVPASQITAGGSDVEEYANLAAFPGTGEVGVLYIALDTDTTYIWDDDALAYVAMTSTGTLPSTVGFKSPCRRVATSNVDITTGGIVSIDGGNTVNKDRILLVGQTAPAENGIYVCNSTGAWSRASDANVISEIRGALVSVWQGTAYGSSLWFTTFKQGNTLGTTAMNWYEMTHAGNIIDMIDTLLGSSAWQGGGGGGVTDFLDLGDVPTDYTGDAGKFVMVKGAEDGLEFVANPSVGLPWELLIACSDETTALTTGTAKVTFRMPRAVTLTAVRASVTTAPTGAVLTVDINEGGSTILSTKLTIDATEKTSTTAAAAAVISDTALADDAEITIDIDTVGSTVAGAGLKVLLKGVIA